ncbi:transporter substrate-binding domain-containing protein [Micromonospora rifamycinica]|uniref:transporter substrate-binding domain-containing protein n=1 Tax=Micromonospora rifamycinica TaxID=291594 RepID=UPI00341875FE
MRLRVRRLSGRVPGRVDPWRGTGPFLALALVAVSTAAFSLVASKSPTIADYLRRSSIAGRELRVGVLADQPLLSTPVGDRGVKDTRAGDTGAKERFTGFDVSLATYLARSIGVSADFVPLEPTERLDALTSGRVDVLLAGLVITAERQRVVEFAGPYLIGGTVVATRTGWPPGSGPGRLCVVPGSAAAADATRSGQPLLLATDLRRCLAAVRAGRADAVVGDEILLRGLVWAAGPGWKVVPFPGMATIAYGIGVARDDPALKALVDSFLVASLRKKQSGAWEVAMDATLRKAGFTGSQPYAPGRLLRDGSDGQDGTGGIVGLPAAVSPVVAGRSRRGRTVAHRRRRRTSGRTVTRRPVGVAGTPAGEPEPGGAAPGASTPGVWSLLVGVPVAVSALYLWIQSGGDRQFTLMLAQSINPINFLAAVSLSVVWVFPALPALVFTIGAVVLGAAVDGADRRRLRDRYAVARWTDRAPGWVVWGSILAAAASTPLVFAPAWALALRVVGRRGAAGRAGGRRPGRGRVAVGLLLYAVIVGAAVGAALAEGEQALALIAGWPAALLLTGVDGPLRPGQVAAFVRAAALLAVLLTLGVLHAVVSTPILPSTAIQVAVPTAAPPTPAPSGSPAANDPDTDPPTRQLRGYVVSTDDESTTVLSDRGGVEIVANDVIRSRVSCPSLVDLPGDSAELFGLPLRESLLKALARQQRPTTVQDPRCLLRLDG